MQMVETNSNIIKLGFVKCQDCEDEPICPHVSDGGCRTKERVKELRIVEGGGEDE